MVFACEESQSAGAEGSSRRGKRRSKGGNWRTGISLESRGWDGGPREINRTNFAIG